MIHKWDGEVDNCTHLSFEIICLFLSPLLSSLCHHYTDVKMGAVASQITSLKIVYSIVYSGTDQRKHQRSASLAFVRGIHRRPVNSPHKWSVTQKMFPFDNVIMTLIPSSYSISPLSSPTLLSSVISPYLSPSSPSIRLSKSPQPTTRVVTISYCESWVKTVCCLLKTVCCSLKILSSLLTVKTIGRLIKIVYFLRSDDGLADTLIITYRSCTGN